MRNTPVKCLLSIVGAALPLFTGCTDDILYDDNTDFNNSDIITFTTRIDAQESFSTRGGPLYEPLVLGGESQDFALYLHTWEHPLAEEVASNGSQTRGAPVSNAKDLSDIHKSFGVMASFVDEGSEYIRMSNTKMLPTGTNTIWTTETPNRWPGDRRLAYNAIAPYNHVSSLKNPAYSKNRISFSYEAMKGNATDDAEKQVDLLMASVTMNRAESKPYNYRTPLKFNHALAAVKFAVRDVLQGKVISISIKGIKSRGDCVFTSSDDSSNGKFEWKNQSGNESYTQVFNHDIEDGNFDPTDESGDIILNNLMPEKTFMLIPQEIPDEAEIEVEIERYNVSPEPSRIKVKGKIKANDLKEWKAGHEYVYTVSTSKDNWVYVFDAKGNKAGGEDKIYVYNPNDERFGNSGNIAEYYVKSYRYRANDQNYIEPLPWKASHGGSYSYLVTGSAETAYPAGNEDQKYVSASQWITDTFETPLRGAGSSARDEYEEHCLDLLPHYVTTNWEGDRIMQTSEPYHGFDKDNPYDLSTFGGKIERTTANCYIVDRGGWYMFPLVYGNAVKDGEKNESAYICQNKTVVNVMSPMVKWDDYGISDPYIENVPAEASAQLIWEDAYQLVDQIELVTIKGERMIRFYVEPNDIHQGNAIVALTDKEGGTVMWSWHIWATEHWLDPDPEKRLPHVFDPENSKFNNFEAAPVTGIRQRGDVAVTHRQEGQKFMMSPYNLGWCDPKNVAYLKRKGEMEYTQYMADGTTKTGKTKKLPIIQDGAIVDYEYGNNTYYQWGRKDPINGFYNHEQQKKAVFGPRLYDCRSQGNISMGDAIKNPEVFYGKTGVSFTQEEDWLRYNGYANLWNNHQDSALDANERDGYQTDLWCHLKTVYDPCPAGYMVPNAGIWRFTYGADMSFLENSGNLEWFKSHINGAYINDYNYKVWGNGIADNNNAIFFSSTGNCWWTDDWVINGITGGGNFGCNVSYAWSNRYVNVENHRSAYGLALGLDTDRVDQTVDLKYFMGAQFRGVRAMGRPIRAIREPN